MRQMLRVLCVALVGSCIAVLGPVSSSSAAVSTYLCVGYNPCKAAGYPHAGYKKQGSKMWWRMYSGHNCTNYVAYRLVTNGHSPERPWTGSGNATNWGVAMKKITDLTPTVGAVAWWKANSPGVGSAGHVAYIEKVVSPTEIIISEDSWGGDFSWRRITKDSTRWPTGFIHFVDQSVTNSTLPSVGGTPVVGGTLTANLGRWTQSPSKYAVQWLADGVPIVGATGTTLVLTPDQRKVPITLRVTASKAGLTSATAVSAPTAPVELGDIATVAPPGLSGTPEAGQTLTVTSGELRPAPKKSTVQWYADQVAIPGATSWNFTPDVAQVDARVSAVVSAKSVGYKWVDVASAATEPILAGAVTFRTPATISGDLQVGQTLTAALPSATPTDAEITQTWLRNGQVVGTGPTYRLGGDDLGARIELRSDAAKPRWRTATTLLPVAGRVATVPRLKVVPKGRTKGSVVKVRVTAPGKAPVTGRVKVKIGKQVQTIKLVDGRVRAIFKGLKRGDRRVKVTYLGAGHVLKEQVRSTVLVR